MVTRQIADEAAMVRFAAAFAAVLVCDLRIGLSGPLAAGKTTFARGVLRALGVIGPVKSPTFTLVETYACDALTVHHFDLYRLVDPGELYYLGFDDYLATRAICLIEWPERGAALVRELDLTLTFEPLSETARTLRLEPHTPSGESLLAALKDR